MTAPLSQTYQKQKSPYRSPAYSVEITRTVGIWPRKVFVQWVLHKPTTGTGYTFNVFRSGGANGPWTQVATDLVDLYFFVDDTFPAPETRTEPGLFSMRRTLYYRVTVTHATDPDTETVKILEAGVDRRRAGMLRKLRRDAAVALRKGSGTEVSILKRRWWGEACTCRSATGQTTRSHCGDCHGTGIVTGYWDAVHGFATRSSRPVENQTASEGTVETHQSQIKMMNIPEVSPRDILVFLRDNKRYIVDRVVTTEIHTVTVHQELEVSEIAHSSSEFKIEVDKWHDPKWF